jgi:hypothetical protein
LRGASDNLNLSRDGARSIRRGLRTSNLINQIVSHCRNRAPLPLECAGAHSRLAQQKLRESWRMCYDQRRVGEVPDGRRRLFFSTQVGRTRIEFSKFLHPQLLDIAYFRQIKIWKKFGADASRAKGEGRYFSFGFW